MQFLKQSTASQSVLIGPFVDSTDGATAETALTITNTDIRLSANGGNMFAKTSGGGTHDELGYYTITLDATDTATVGRLQLAVKMTGALPVYHEFQILEEEVYDALFSAAAVGPLLANSNGSGLTEAGGTGDHLTAVPWNAAWDAEVQSEVQDAIEANHLDHLLAVDYDPAAKPGTATALLNELVESDAGVSRFTANALEQAPSGGSAPTVGEIADAVWTEAIADHSGTAGSTAEALNAAGSAGDPWVTALPGAYGAGSAGKILGDNLNATVSSRATQTSVDTIDGIVDAILVDTADMQPKLVGTIATGTHNPQTGDAFARLGAAGAGLTALGDTRIANLDATVSTRATPAQVATELATYDGPTNAEMEARTLAAASYATAAALTTVDNEIATIDTVVDAILAMLDDARTEPGQGAPPVSPDLATKIDYLYKAWRNKKDNNGTETKLYADDGTTVDHKQTTAESGGTVTKGEWATGA